MLSFQGKTAGVPNPVYAIVFVVKVILTDHRLVWCRPRISFCGKVRNYRNKFAMEIHILSRNYGQIRQRLSKRFIFYENLNLPRGVE